MATEINLQKNEQNRLQFKKKKNCCQLYSCYHSASVESIVEKSDTCDRCSEDVCPWGPGRRRLEEDSPWSAFLGVWTWVLPLLLLPLKNFFETGVSLNSELTDSTGLSGWWAPGVLWALPFQSEEHRSMLPNPAFHGNSGSSELWSSCVCVAGTSLTKPPPSPE